MLGPLLFTMYTAPLADISKHGFEVQLFADDTQIYITCKTPSFVQSSLELCIDEVRDWMRDNMLVLNDSKTELMVFTSKFNGDKDRVLLENFRVGDSTVDVSSQPIRNLGVMIDVSLCMDDHVKHVCRAASFALYKIGRIRRYLDLQRSLYILL